MGVCIHGTVPFSSVRAAARANTVGLVTEIASPYRIPVFNALNQLLDGRLRVFFLAAMAGRAWPVRRRDMCFSYEIARGLARRIGGPDGPIVYLNAPLIGRLRRAGVGPLVVGGYNHLDFLWSAFHSATAGHPLLLWSESVDAAERRPPIRTMIKRAAVGACDAYVVPGSAAATQLRYLGADPGRIFLAPNAVDTSFWAARAAPRPAVGREPRLLFVGNLVHRKGLDLLIDALADPDLRRLTLDVVGSGPLRDSLRERARLKNLRVRFHGELGREKLRQRYRDADLLILPTRSDPWGLVLNEGMCTGCVPVTTGAAGAAGDLVEDGITGRVVPPGDVAALRSALRDLAASPPMRHQLSKTALRRATDVYSPDRCAFGFLDALRACGWER